jgi:metallo-beta-lactamase family protein
LRAQVSVLNGYSAHADRNELLSWLEAVRSKSPKLTKVFLVHGEPEAQAALSDDIRKMGIETDAPPFGAVRVIS